MILAAVSSMTEIMVSAENRLTYMENWCIIKKGENRWPMTRTDEEKRLFCTEGIGSEIMERSSGGGYGEY
jgi:hypothetical protein